MRIFSVPLDRESIVWIRRSPQLLKEQHFFGVASEKARMLMRSGCWADFARFLFCLCLQFWCQLFDGVLYFVPFVHVSDLEFVFSFPGVVSFLPEVHGDAASAEGLYDHDRLPPFFASEYGLVVYDFVEFG